LACDFRPVEKLQIEWLASEINIRVNQTNIRKLNVETAVKK